MAERWARPDGSTILWNPVGTPKRYWPPRHTLDTRLPAAVLIFGPAAAPLSLPARMLSIPIVVLQLGEASYAFYLVHMPALSYFGAGRWVVATSPTTVLYEALTLGAILCLAVGLHVMVERPARLYIRRLVWAPTAAWVSNPAAIAEPDAAVTTPTPAADHLSGSCREASVRPCSQ